MTQSESIERIEASALAPIGFDHDSPLWWGQLLMCVAEGVSLILMVAIYFYARLQFDEWPPAGANTLDWKLPAANMALLILSCLPMRLGDKAILRDDWRGAQFWSWIATAMGAAAAALQIYLMSLFKFRWDSHLYGSVVWFTLGFHTLHVVVATLETATILTFAGLGYKDERVKLALNVDEVYWFMVVVSAAVIYAVVFAGSLF
jgi:heme/copper-type cytochrome/quinol oxidase subunit 3